jgi:zinc transporter 1
MLCSMDDKSIRLLLMMSMTGAYFVVELVVGYLTCSMTLVTDSFHMLSDVLALLVAFVCTKVDNDNEHALS